MGVSHDEGKVKPMKTVVWDWNGTLLDDVEVCIETVNAMLRQRNLPTLESVDQYQNVFTFPVIDYYRRVGFDLHVPITLKISQQILLYLKIHSF